MLPLCYLIWARIDIRLMGERGEGVFTSEGRESVTEAFEREDNLLEIRRQFEEDNVQKAEIDDEVERDKGDCEQHFARKGTKAM